LPNQYLAGFKKSKKGIFDREKPYGKQDNRTEFPNENLPFTSIINQSQSSFDFLNLNWRKCQ